ncbi:GNAT family N-acetyltransferase [Streptomyces qinzhouensis]|uniref:GNAT family N-acetyltransferase n=1 Tax=Streptomyces qinzhouensis TaxID=2599401 RepID=A0A5B8IIK4_9ACTN|nr:GNAT family N-acetyltransferase [Streptomyces qinzhouensis]QDY78242.1 GNAT family N-acetyltransferase [Streptomyces qinzhouensis]
MSADIQNFAVANLRRRPETAEVAGFVLGFDPTTTSSYINFATPLPGIRPTRGDIAALVAAFHGRGLVPRLEFAPDAAPEVAPALRRAGFGTEATQEYLVRRPGGLVAPEGPLALTPGTDEEYAAVDAALCEAFGGEDAPSPEGAARLRRTQETGGAIRYVAGPGAGGAGCAGAGICSPVAEGTAELAGIGTRPECRGRGVAAAVTAALTRAAFEAGAASAWLESSGDGSRRVYERLGYRAAGTRLYMTLA